MDNLKKLLSSNLSCHDLFEKTINLDEITELEQGKEKNKTHKNQLTNFISKLEKTAKDLGKLKATYKSEDSKIQEVEAYHKMLDTIHNNRPPSLSEMLINDMLDLFNENGAISYEDIKRTILSYTQDTLFEDVKTIDRIVDIYLKRFFSVYPDIQKNENHVSVLQCTAFAIALKVWHDDGEVYLSDSDDLQNIIDFKILSKVEKEFLKAINWNVNISENDLLA